ncbi:hypothetical protein [Rhodopirellula bahusiensis]|uniref:Uncharacterized protein n=1 Tax=Rhodopirellula bahusiensis TaxID=2014065 RepID=A0A2G1W7W8_9BACT|nr:hypothetical protein [Rhodopirellula bahusiensis]PHQ35132.1 hypothetical protein CEE69_11990 [Rhodopirellula bahusiensis]
MAEHFPPADDDQHDIKSLDAEKESPPVDGPRAVFAGVAALTVMGIGAFAIRLMLETTSPPSRDASAASASHDPSDETYVERATPDGVVAARKQPVSDTTKVRQEEHLAIRSSSNMRIVLRRDKLFESLDLLLLEHNNWVKYSPEMIGSEMGHQIASDEALVERFAAVLDRDMPTESELNSFRDRYIALSKVVDSLASDASYEPSRDFDEAIGALTEEVETALALVASRREDANAIGRLALSLAPADQTLADAIEQFRQRRIAARIETVADAKRAADAEMVDRITAKEMEQARIRREIDLAVLDSQTAELAETQAKLKRMAEAEGAERQRRARLAVLESEFNRDLGQITSLLKPFISHGRTQPGSRGWRSDATYGPVSLSKLRSAGLLEDTVESRQNLYYLTTGNRYNDREHGAFPRYVGGAGDWQRKHPTIERAQDLLQKYGELMVDKNMLAP